MREAIGRAFRGATILETAMNADTLKGQWKQLRGKIQQKWGKLTNDDLDVIDGNLDELSGRIQEKYGHRRDAVEKALDELGQARADQRENQREL